MNIHDKRPIALEEYRDRTLYTTWDISYTRLQNEDPDAAQLLKTLAYFDNQAIWYELLFAGIEEDSPKWLRDLTANDVNFTDKMTTLTDYCFVQVQRKEHQATAYWSMHNCVHDWTIAVLNHDIDVQLYWYAFDCVAASIPECYDFDLQLPLYAGLAAHAQRLVQDQFWQNKYIYTIVPRRLIEADRIAILLRFQAHLIAAEQLFERALTSSEHALGAKHHTTLNLVSRLGSVYQNQDKLVLAEQFLTRALSGLEKLLDPKHADTLRVISDLGSLYQIQEKLVLAQHSFERVLEAQEELLGLKHIVTLRTTFMLATIYMKQDDLVQAEQLFRRALVSCHEVLGGMHQLTLDTTSDYAILCFRRGKLTEAEQLLQQAHVGYQERLGVKHESTLAALARLGWLYYEQGNLVQAEQYYQRALAGYEALQLENIGVLELVFNFGILCMDQNRMSEARDMFQRSSLGLERILGANHPTTLKAVNLLEKAQSMIEKEGNGAQVSEEGEDNEANEEYEDDEIEDEESECAEEEGREEETRTDQHGQTSTPGIRRNGLRSRLLRRFKISRR